MKINSIHELFSYLRADRMSLVYAGSFEDAVTTKAIKLSEHNIEKSEELASLKKKSSFLMAECFQNVVRHNETESVSNYRLAEQGFFMTRSRGNMYFIASSNIINKKLIPELTTKLEHLNEMTKEELKQMYMNVLRNKGLSEKGGAGLGLIEMARKSGHPLSFSFKEMDGDHAMFYLLIQMKSGDESVNSERIEMDAVEEIHRIMIDNDIMLIYKGDFSRESISPIINMLETNLRSHDIEHFENKKIFVTLVEMIQNISTHALNHEGIKAGILAISRRDGSYQLGTGNFINNGTQQKITGHLDKINNMSFDELRKEYKDALFKTTLEEYDAELGLIDIAKTSKRKLRYDFDNSFDSKSFFSLMVDI